MKSRLPGIFLLGLLSSEPDTDLARRIPNLFSQTPGCSMIG
jgi:hypothetical protein